MKFHIPREYAESFCKTVACHWEVVDEIGKGNSASVFQLSDHRRSAALKVYHPRFFHGAHALVERRRVSDQMTLQGHQHPNLIDFLDAGPIEDTYYMLMEYLPWKSLDKHIETIDRSSIARIISQVSDAALYLEDRGFVHRDIKPQNILISDDHQKVKLLDLGVMRPISTQGDGGTDDGYALPFVATAQYSSPAYLFRDGPPTQNMWRALTFYQIGAVLHDLLMRAPLFANEVRTNNRYRVAAAVLLTDPSVRAHDVPPWLVVLARNCLVKDDNVRLGRVNWSSFRKELQLDLDQLRNKLGLRVSRIEDNPDRQRQELLRVRLDRGRDVLADLVHHVIRKESFPQDRLQHLPEGAQARSMVFGFRPSGVSDSTVELQFVLRLDLSDLRTDRVDILFSCFLKKCDGDVGGDCVGNLLWSTRLGEIEEEHTELVGLLTENFVLCYGSAYDRLAEFEEGEETLWEVRLNNDG